MMIIYSIISVFLSVWVNIFYLVLLTRLDSSDIVPNVETTSNFKAARDVWHFSNRIAGDYTVDVFTEEGSVLGIEMVGGGILTT